MSPREGGLLGPLEELVLLSLAHVRADAYGMTVRRRLLDRTGHEVSIGAVYSTLDRMERKGLVASRLADPDPIRGGHPRRYFELTTAGWEAVREARRLREVLWDGLVEGGIHG